jgi:hypothetical protein
VLHAYEHAPLVHVPDAFATPVVQAVAVLQVPLAWQLSRLFPEHSVCPGAHVPVHAPPTQVWLEHAAGELHDPSAWQDSTPLLAQLVCPGAQTPAQAPLTHVLLVQAAAALHVPLD